MNIHPPPISFLAPALHTDTHLSFNSHHPRSPKKSLFTTLSQRAENLTSNDDARENERQYVANVLNENNYPKSAHRPVDAI